LSKENEKKKIIIEISFKRPKKLHKISKLKIYFYLNLCDFTWFTSL